MKHIIEHLITIAQAINAGVYDPGIFKAVFLAGGPGSGKSYITRETTTGLGLKVVNSDSLYEHLVKKAGKSLDMEKMSEEEWAEVQRIRNAAKSKTNLKMDLHVNGRLGVVVDGTGRDFTKIKRQKELFDSIGYDTYMIFVNTTLDVALERNAKRERKVPVELVTQYWNDVQQNMGKFQSLFGANNFIIYDNSVYTEDRSVLNDIWKKVMLFIKKPVKSHVAKKWIEEELKRKRK
jgi:cytidylate kinase